jgi:hypothetical protein
VAPLGFWWLLWALLVAHEETVHGVVVVYEDKEAGRITSKHYCLLGFVVFASGNLNTWTGLSVARSGCFRVPEKQNMFQHIYFILCTFGDLIT